MIGEDQPLSTGVFGCSSRPVDYYLPLPLTKVLAAVSRTKEENYGGKIPVPLN